MHQLPMQTESAPWQRRHCLRRERAPELHRSVAQRNGPLPRQGCARSGPVRLGRFWSGPNAHTEVARTLQRIDDAAANDSAAGLCIRCPRPVDPRFVSSVETYFSMDLNRHNVRIRRKIAAARLQTRSSQPARS
jgi:hypothetical protein